MNSAPKLTKKQKKALAFRERKGKGKAKATEDQEENDVPIMEYQDIAAAEMADSALEGAQADKRGDDGHEQVVEGKKRKRDTSEAGEQEQEKGKSKKRKGISDQMEVVAGEDGGETSQNTPSETKAKSKQQRFILFVGMHSLFCRLYSALPCLI